MIRHLPPGRARGRGGRASLRHAPDPARSATLVVRDRAGIEQEIARLGEGEYFGEQSIVSTQVSITALEDLKVLVLDSETLDVLLDQLPRLAREIGSLMDIRRKAAQSARNFKPTAKWARTIAARRPRANLSRSRESDECRHRSPRESARTRLGPGRLPGDMTGWYDSPVGQG